MKPSNEIPRKVLLDTTFLVDLANPTSPYRDNAQEYAIQLLANKATFYLSSLVIAEFSIKGNLDNAIRAFSPRQIEFGREDAEVYAELAKLHPGIFNLKVPDKERVVIDLMLIAQAKRRGIDAVLSTDSALCSIYLKGTSVVGLDIKMTYSDFLTSKLPLFNGNNLN